MATPLFLLKCLGKAVLKVLPQAAIKALPFGEAAMDIAKAAYKEWSQGTAGAVQRQKEVQALAQASSTDMKAAIGTVVQQIAGCELHQEVQEMLTNYLTLVPNAIHRSLRRPSDPSGRTVPPQLLLDQADDLIPLLPTRLPHFKPGVQPDGLPLILDELLGVGGFGEVWKAHDAYLVGQPPVALKFCLDEESAKTLWNEVSLFNHRMGKEQHPGIVRLVKAHLHAKPPCLEYEFIEGGDLAGYIRDHAPRPGVGLPPVEATRVMYHIADAVWFAHQRGIVHRDLKPANILVQRTAKGGPTFRVTDFGIGGLAAAQAVREATRLGGGSGWAHVTSLQGAYTPLYASPQQIKGGPADPRDDIHALGVIWYQLLTGNLSMTAIPPEWHDDVERCGLPAPLVKMLGSCIASKAEKRPNAQELMQSIIVLVPPYPKPPSVVLSPPTSPVTLPSPPSGGVVAPQHKNKRELTTDQEQAISKQVLHHFAPIIAAGKKPNRKDIVLAILAAHAQLCKAAGKPVTPLLPCEMKRASGGLLPPGKDIHTGVLAPLRDQGRIVHHGDTVGYTLP